MNIIKIKIILSLQLLICCLAYSQKNTSPLKALILDGSNNHYVWPKTSLMMKDYLEKKGLFEVEIERLDTVWKGFKYFSDRPEAHDYFLSEFPMDTIKRPIVKDAYTTTDFKVDFKKYDLVVSNLGAFTPSWSKCMQRKFESYMKKGGGLVVVHAANNAWGDWEEYNKMIGLGAWGDRNTTTGPFVYVEENGEVKKDTSARVCASHGKEYEFVIQHREPEHPILKGLPKEWLHTKDELYDRMRGPFINATILATAYADVEFNDPWYDKSIKGTGKHVPMLLTVNYGKGRVFHSTLGHFDYSMECVGFMTTFQRGAEWAATGSVTQKIPKDFPNKEFSKSRKWKPIFTNNSNLDSKNN